jgi:serine/threonine protein kinase SCH9
VSGANVARTSAPGAAQPPNAPSRQPKGQIHVKLIAARGLNVQSAHARPYVVVEFEQNEFVSRDPIGETEKEIRGAPTAAGTTTTVPPSLSRAGSSTALASLGAINSKALAADTHRGGAIAAAAAGKSSSATTPTAVGSNASSASSTKSHLASLVANATASSRSSSSGTSSSSSKAATTAPSSLFGQPPAHNPVWKHEVTL